MSHVTSHRSFNPSRNILAMAVCMATLNTALAEDSAAAQETSGAAAVELNATAITTSQLGSTTEGSNSYTTGAMSTATKLPLTMRETPQAVTVITRQRMDDQAMTSINDVVRATPGLYLNFSNGPGRQAYTARGFDIDNLMYDGSSDLLSRRQ
jgi:outer membrane receptor for ferric coprogen and ferric-rhodotorulic acid